MTSYFLDSNPARQPPIDGPAFVFFFMCCCCCCAGKLADRKLQSLAERKRKKEKEKKEKKKTLPRQQYTQPPDKQKEREGSRTKTRKASGFRNPSSLFRCLCFSRSLSLFDVWTPFVFSSRRKGCAIASFFFFFFFFSLLPK